MSARPSPGFLARVPLSELKTVRVNVRRANITTCNSPGPIERAIEDPIQIGKIIHLLRNDKARNSYPIFSRHNELIKQKETLMLPDDNRIEEQKSRKSNDRSISNSPKNDCVFSNYEEKSESRSPEKDKYVRIVISSERKEKLSEESDKFSRNGSSLVRLKSLDKDSRRNLDKKRGRDQRRYTDRPYSRERKKESNRRRSKTPLRPGEYRPNHGDESRRTRSRNREYPHEKSRCHSRRSRSLSHKRCKGQVPEYRKPSTSRNPSRSPEPYSLGKNRREKSPSRYKRERKWSRSPNKAGTSSSSSGRHDKYSRRHSRSPRPYDGDRDQQNKRSRSSKSPHSPIVRDFNRSRSDSRRSSRSPLYERENNYHRSKKYRSRSRTPTRSRSRSPYRHRELDFAYYKGIPASKCWMPASIRPNFPAMHRFYPHAFYPRIPSAPIILPPRFPMVAAYPPFSQRLPVYNTRPKLKTPTQGQSTTDNNMSDSTIVASNEGNKDDKITIQEI